MSSALWYLVGMKYKPLVHGPLIVLALFGFALTSCIVDNKPNPDFKTQRLGESGACNVREFETPKWVCVTFCDNLQCHWKGDK